MPEDIANNETEARIKYLERRLKREYEQAARNVEEKFEKMTADFAKKDAEKRRQMQYGLINEDEYTAWRKRQLAAIERLENMADELAEEYVHANEAARAIVAGEMPAIYAENHNFATWEAEEYGRINTGYTLYNPETIGILMADDPTLLPLPSKKRLQELAEKDLLWNKQLVTSAIMQGILQGESVNKMARRVAQATGEKDYHAAVRNARTMSTMVQNKAREDAFKRAKNRGSDIKQMWLATLDGRTRHAHRQLDRQVRDVGEPFEVDGYKIAYPADPAAPAYLVYNCRCTVRGVIGGLELMASKTLDYSQLGGQSYEEWKQGKAKNESQKRVDEGEERARAAKAPKYETAEKPWQAKGLLKKLGFDPADNLMMDKELLVDVANRLSELSTKYPILGSDANRGIKFKVDDLGNFAIAAVNANMKGVDTSLALNIRNFGKKSRLITDVKRRARTGWIMPFDEKNAHIYDVTHEYGHMVQDFFLFGKEYQKGYAKLKSGKERDNYFWRNYTLKSEEQRQQIIKIAKELNPEFDLKKNISGYGKSDANEFFAEVFANSQCGNPNDLGKAMIEWLKRRGF